MSTDPSIVALARELAELREKVDDRTPQLQFSSVEVPEYVRDENGLLVVDPETGDYQTSGVFVPLPIPEIARTNVITRDEVAIAAKVARDADAFARNNTGRVIFSDTEPPEDARTEWVLWIDTSPTSGDDPTPLNLPKRWNGEAWESVPDATISVAQSTAERALSDAEVARTLGQDGLDAINELDARVAEVDETNRTLIAQLPDEILSQVESSYATRYFEAGDDGEPVEVTVETLLSRLSQTAEGFVFTIAETNERITAQDEALEANAAAIAEQLTLIRLEQDGIHIGRSEDPVTMRLSNGSLDFYMAGERVAWFDGAENVLRIRDAVVEQTLTVGSDRWVPEPTGGMSLVGA